MGAVYFYHLTRQPLEVTLPILLGKARAAGWRVAVRGVDRAQMEWLDQKLWTGPGDGFLAHGLSGGDYDADQPILLTIEAQAANTPECVMSVHSAVISPLEVAGFKRVCILFDGNDPDAVQQARSQWKSLTESGAAAQYWSEESGRWEMKAEHKIQT